MAFEGTWMSSTAKYNSEDLALLPIEDPAAPFFYPVEFKANGSLAVPDQATRFHNRLAYSPNKPAHIQIEEPSPITDVFVSIHGWDKTCIAAERDYQDFICRLAKYSGAEPLGRESKPIVVGVFWPSTFWPNYGDPAIFKPFTYHFIRRRACRIGAGGFADQVIRPLAVTEGGQMRNRRYHFICHSFGAQMALAGLRKYYETAGTLGWLQSAEKVNLIFLLPAVRQGDVRSAVQPLLENLRAQSTRARVGSEFDNWTRKVIVHVVYSRHDFPNRTLFPIVESFHKSMGACGELRETRGQLADESAACGPEIHNWDLSDVIYGHGDIYKGRVAKKVWSLIKEGEPCKQASRLPIG